MRASMFWAIVSMIGASVGMNVLPILVFFKPDTADTVWIRLAAQAAMVAFLFGGLAMIAQVIREERSQGKYRTIYPSN